MSTRACSKGKLAFLLHGERLKGKWALVRLRSANQERQGQLAADQGARRLRPPRAASRSPSARPRASNPAARWTRSRGRQEEGLAFQQAGQVDEIERPRRRSDHSREAGRGEAKAAKAKQQDSVKKNSARRQLPAFVEPQLATLVDEPPPGNDWLHEIKYDGYRVIAAIAGGEVVLYTRNGLDWTRAVSRRW